MLMPQMNDAASVDNTVSVRYVRRTRCAPSVMGGLYRRTYGAPTGEAGSAASKRGESTGNHRPTNPMPASALRRARGWLGCTDRQPGFKPKQPQISAIIGRFRSDPLPTVGLGNQVAACPIRSRITVDQCPKSLRVIGFYEMGEFMDDHIVQYPVGEVGDE